MGTNLRHLAESHLSITLEGDWSFDVNLMSPDGVPDSAKGQVIFDTLRENPDTGEMIVSNNPVVVLRNSSLKRVPKAGEKWVFNIPTTPVLNSPRADYLLLPTRAPEGGKSIGFTRFYLRRVQQS